MATRDGEVRVQVPLTTELARQMDHLAVELRPYVEDRDRAMQRGPMLAYLARWFYGLPRGTQGEILNQGRSLAREDRAEGVPDFREAHARYLASLQKPEWLAGVSAAIEGESVGAGAPSDDRGGRTIPMVPGPDARNDAKSKKNRKRAKSLE